jgi:eukaryotic-like serine/threonine-protein kinase
LMKSEFTLDHVRARNDYLKVLLEKYPNGNHAERARTMVVEIDKEDTLNKMRARVKTRQPPLNEAESQFRIAEKFANFGDSYTALRKYRAIVELFKTEPELKIYVLLAQDEVDRIKSQSSDETLSSFLNKRLRDAEEEKQKGRLSKAEEIWNSIKTLYENDDEAAVHVAFARKRLREEDPGPPPWAEAAGQPQPSN